MKLIRNIFLHLFLIYLCLNTSFAQRLAHPAQEFFWQKSDESCLEYYPNSTSSLSIVDQIPVATTMDKLAFKIFLTSILTDLELHPKFTALLYLRLYFFADGNSCLHKVGLSEEERFTASQLNLLKTQLNNYCTFEPAQLGERKRHYEGSIYLAIKNGKLQECDAGNIHLER